MLEEKHKKQFEDFDRQHQAYEPKNSRSLIKKNYSEKPNEDQYKSRDKLDDGAKSATGRESGNIYGSHNDLSLSSNSKAHQT